MRFVKITQVCHVRTYGQTDTSSWKPGVAEKEAPSAQLTLWRTPIALWPKRHARGRRCASRTRRRFASTPNFRFYVATQIACEFTATRCIANKRAQLDNWKGILSCTYRRAHVRVRNMGKDFGIGIRFGISVPLPLIREKFSELF